MSPDLFVMFSLQSTYILLIIPQIWSFKQLPGSSIFSLCSWCVSQRASSFGNNLACTREEADDSGSSSSKVSHYTIPIEWCLHIFTEMSLWFLNNFNHLFDLPLHVPINIGLLQSLTFCLGVNRRSGIVRRSEEWNSGQRFYKIYLFTRWTGHT